MSDPPLMTPDDADSIAARLLGELRTKLGGLHIVHARRIAERARPTGDRRVIAAALLHDVLEKTATTADELRTMTGDAHVVELVEVLTQRPGERYQDYLARCVEDPAARLLKRYDLEDKLLADDSAVPATVADRLRHKARARLALLDRLAARRRD